MGDELLHFSEDLKQTIGKLRELETTSSSGSKIGLKAIQVSIQRLLVIEEDVDKQILALENNFTNK